jgi:hypothetical protein
MFSRREFVKGLGAITGVLLAPFDRLTEGSTGLLLNSSTSSELFNGFILLSEDAPLPEFITPPRLGVPIICGVGTGRGGTSAKAVRERTLGLAQLRQRVPFKVYSFRNLPEEFGLTHTLVLRHETGVVYDSRLGKRTGLDSQRRTIRLLAKPEFLRPYPLRSSKPREPGGPTVTLQKVDFLPTPGVMILTQEGYIFHWIENDILYTLYANLPEPLPQVQALLSQLTGE